jgi:hypothetical protein
LSDDEESDQELDEQECKNEEWNEKNLGSDNLKKADDVVKHVNNKN